MEDLYRNIELPLIYTLFHMEDEGIAVRREELTAYGGKLKKQIAVLEKEIWEMTGQEFNINSPKQLGEILFEKMQIKGGKKDKDRLFNSGRCPRKARPGLPGDPKDLRLQTVYKIKFHLRGRPGEHISKTMAGSTAALTRRSRRLDGSPVRSRTSRISRSAWNLEGKIRKVFVPRDGFLFLDADYSQIELRVLAHMSGDERLIEAYKTAQDIHAITASQVFHIPLNEVTPLQRRNAKAVNFGIVYGISAFGLSEDLSISRKEAMEYIERYFETYPQVKSFLDSLVAHAKEHGVRHHHVRTPPPGAGAKILELYAAFLRRARGDELPDPGNRRGHHQDRHDPGG